MVKKPEPIKAKCPKIPRYAEIQNKYAKDDGIVNDKHEQEARTQNKQIHRDLFARKVWNFQA